MQSKAWITAAVLAAVSATAHSATAGLIQSSLTLTEPASAAPAGGERIGSDLAIVDVTGIPSMAPTGSPSNIVMNVWIGPFNYLTGLGWDVVLQTVAPGSRLSHIGVRFSDTVNSPSMAIGFWPGIFDPVPGGPTAYSSDGQIVKFQQHNIQDVRALADGLIRLEFFDSPDDAIGAMDSLWVSGTLRLQTLFTIPAIPAPHVSGLFILAGVASMIRRRVA